MFWKMKPCRPTWMASAAAVILAVALLPSSAAADQPADWTGMWVGIEIGGSDVKMVVLKAKKGPKFAESGPEFELIAGHEPVTTNISGDLQNGGKDFNDNAIKNTVAAVSEMRDFAYEKKVPKNRVYVAVSAGVGKFKASKKYEELIKKVDELFPEGNKVAEITTDDEVGFTFLRVVPQVDQKDALYIDIGGSDTKFGYVINGKPTTGRVPFGTTSIREEQSVKGVAPLEERFKAMHKLTVDKLKEEKKKVDLTKPKVYLGGGASWCMAVLEEAWDGEAPATGPGKPVKINPSKSKPEMTTITRFAERVRDSKADIDQLDTKKPALKNEADEVRKRFNSKDKLLASAAILKALEDEFDLANDKKVTVYFVPNSHLAWIQGFVTKRVLEQIPPEPTPPPQPDFAKAIEDLKKEVEKGNTQLEAIDKSLTAISEKLAKIAENSSRPSPPVDFKPLLDELGKIQNAIKEYNKPPPPVDFKPLLDELGKIENAVKAKTGSSGGSDTSDPMKPPSDGPAKPAHVVIKAPANMSVSVDGQPLFRENTTETFETPDLTPGKTYSYVFTAQVIRDGQRIVLTKKVIVRAGKTSEVDFSAEMKAVLR